MSFFTKITKVVDLGDGNTVTLQKATFGDSQEAQSRSMRVKEDKTLELDWPRYRLEMLKRSIASWDGPGFDGQPPTGENVEALPPDIGGKLAEEAMSISTLSADEGN